MSISPQGIPPLIAILGGTGVAERNTAELERRLQNVTERLLGVFEELDFVHSMATAVYLVEGGASPTEVRPPPSPRKYWTHNVLTKDMFCPNKE